MFTCLLQYCPDLIEWCLACFGGGIAESKTCLLQIVIAESSLLTIFKIDRSKEVCILY
jgi:hypothetical protein